MKKSKKQSNLKVLATTSALIGVCCVGSGLNAETASASTSRIPTINTSTQTGSSSLGTRLWNGFKRPFTNAGRLLGGAWNSLKSCFGFKSTNSNIQDIEMQPVSNADKSKTLKRGFKPTSSDNLKTTTPRSTGNIEEVLGNSDPIYKRVKKYNPKSGGSSTTPKQDEIHYANLRFKNSSSTGDVRPRTTPETIYTQVNTGGSSKQPQEVTYASLNFDGSNSTSDVRPRTTPETIYTQVNTGGSSTKNKITVTADIHTPSSENTTPPPLPPKSSSAKTGTDNKGFNEDVSPTPKLITFYQGYKQSNGIYNLGFSGDDGSSASGEASSSTKSKPMSSPPPLPPKSSIASGGASSSKKPKQSSSLISMFNKSSKSSTKKTGINNKGFDEDNNPTKGRSFYQDFLVLSDEGGIGSPDKSKPKRLFYNPQFDTDENGANPVADPIYQPIGNFTSTSQTQTSSTGSGGGNKPPVPAPRTKLQTKQ